VASPVRISEHAEPDNIVRTWLGIYAATHAGVRAANNGSVRLGPEDEPQPDAMMWHEGDQPRIDADRFFSGSPDLAAEIAASTANIAMCRKMESYRRAGVSEYVVWLTLECRFLWYRLRDGEYEPLSPGPDG
jgi:Uma2 family endonuclease